ncbi:SDR family NAD(P)-dependent oxidoreductase [Alginatibacterium sediminis]|uniref:SDR family NAD(P)-dependent oxidoreductase n=1 Tax=Alginatibacterium sediminis TaxID=2164068 RepID=A0A420E8F4_9ALTE|nr:SDR family NAD(P)-dependent oxidoreductase [Alginatibacterium sediminis]RKF15604.1 SDR family NAD(P)-dependent oxidoreductase [Alginatibacterium sediminis]
MSKTILITGATDGIGLKAAMMLAQQGHRLLLHGRSVGKLELSKNQLLAQTPNAELECYCSDLSLLSNVGKLADEICTQYDSIDVLINNAGIYSAAKLKTEDGLDLRFAVNTIAPYLLTRRLLPLLASSARVVNVSSAAQSTIDADALAGRKQLSDGEAYAQSKLAIAMWSHCLAQELKDSGPIVLALNPASMLGSKMVKDAFGVAGGDLKIGAEIIVKAALSNEFSSANGLYFDNDIGQFSKAHPDVYNQDQSKLIMSLLDTFIV